MQVKPCISETEIKVQSVTKLIFVSLRSTYFLLKWGKLFWALFFPSALLFFRTKQISSSQATICWPGQPVPVFAKDLKEIKRGKFPIGKCISFQGLPLKKYYTGWIKEQKFISSKFWKCAPRWRCWRVCFLLRLLSLAGRCPNSHGDLT